jgi:hypothetical protein
LQRGRVRQRQHGVYICALDAKVSPLLPGLSDRQSEREREREKERERVCCLASVIDCMENEMMLMYLLRITNAYI